MKQSRLSVLDRDALHEAMIDQRGEDVRHLRKMLVFRLKRAIDHLRVRMVRTREQMRRHKLSLNRQIQIMCT